MPKINPKIITIFVVIFILMMFIGIKSLQSEKKVLERKVEQRKNLCDVMNFTFYIDRCNVLIGCPSFCYKVRDGKIIEAYEFRTLMGAEHMVKMKEKK